MKRRRRGNDDHDQHGPGSTGIEFDDAVDASDDDGPATPLDDHDLAGDRPVDTGGEPEAERRRPDNEPIDPGHPPVVARSPERHAANSFWDRYDDASREAELLQVPPVAVTAIVGPLDETVALAERYQTNHWAGGCDVFVLTTRPETVADKGWVSVHRGSDLIAAAEDPANDFPLLVLDVPRELPVWLRPLLDRLRQGGLGLVHYALAGDPSDEDLATWHGEIGRPAVLDLVSPLPPARILALLDRGEPIASIGGVPATAQLLFSLRAEVGR